MKMPDWKFILNRAKYIKMSDIGSKIIDRMKDINVKLRKLNPKQFKQMIDRLKLLITLIKDYWNGDYREIPWLSVTLISFSIVYFFSPVDLIPDYIPGVGYLDDAAVITLVWMSIKSDLEEYAKWKGISFPA